MEELDIEKIKEEIKNKLSEKRYNHSIGTMKRAEKMAKIYNIDVEKAKLAGLTHDIAKELSQEEKLKYVKKNNIKIDEVERLCPDLLHGKIAAHMCKIKYGFDEEMQEAIAFHTTAKVNMSVLGKIIFLADITEENRNFEDVDILRELSEKNLDEAMLYALNKTIEKTVKTNKLLHPDSVNSRNHILSANYKM